MSPKLSRHQQIGEDYQTLCRLCLKKTDLKIDIYREEGLQKDIPGKILNCLSLIVTDRDLLPKFVCVPCVNKLDNFHDFRDMCHESENLLTSYVSAVEECIQKKQSQEAPSASSSSPQAKAGSKRKRDFEECISSSHQGPPPNFVSCAVKTEPQDVPSQEETVGSSWQPTPSTVKSEPKEEEMIVVPNIVSGSSSQQYGAGTSAFGEEESKQFVASDSSAQFGAFEDSDNDISDLEHEEVMKAEVTVGSKGHPTEGERYSLSNAGRRIGAAFQADNRHSPPGEGYLVSDNMTKEMAMTGTSSQSSKVSLANDCARNFNLARSEDQFGSLSTTKEPYICRECNKTFSRSYHLRVHKRIHSGERPFLCPTCNKAFRLKHHLTRHSRIHTGGYIHHVTDLLDIKLSGNFI